MTKYSQRLHVIAAEPKQDPPPSHLQFWLCLLPLGGAFLSLWFYAALGMKLYSYQETNHWYRNAHVSDAGISQLWLSRWFIY